LPTIDLPVTGARHVCAPPLIPGYELLGLLGQGGMGVVYKARQIALNRSVALKMVLAGAAAKQEQLSRFRAEAETLACLQHPGIVQIFEIGEHEGRPYFALEYVNGGSLDKQLASTPQPPQEAAALVEKLARTMQVAHERGIVHRDLKPANILLVHAEPTPDTTHHSRLSTYQPKITDFGLAKQLDGDSGQTRTGQILGTPSYMAPEQATGRLTDIGAATDVYALGAILYEALTGRPPFRGATSVETLMQVTNDEPVAPTRLNPQVPRDLETVCLKALQKEIARRYRMAHDLADDLRRYLDGVPVQARPLSTWERGWKWACRRPALAGLLGVSVVAALALVGSAVSLFYSVKLQGALIEAESQRQDANQQRALARRYMYVAQMNLADRAAQLGHIQQVRELLQMHLPAAGEVDLRGF
jgi:serine/threonine protein kinase